MKTLKITQEQVYNLQNMGLPSAMTSNNDGFWSAVIVGEMMDLIVLHGEGSYIHYAEYRDEDGNMSPITNDVYNTFIQNYGN